MKNMYQIFFEPPLKKISAYTPDTTACNMLKNTVDETEIYYLPILKMVFNFHSLGHTGCVLHIATDFVM